MSRGKGKRQRASKKDAEIYQMVDEEDEDEEAIDEDDEEYGAHEELDADDMDYEQEQQAKRSSRRSKKSIPKESSQQEQTMVTRSSGRHVAVDVGGEVTAPNKRKRRKQGRPAKKPTQVLGVVKPSAKNKPVKMKTADLKTFYQNEKPKQESKLEESQTVYNAVAKKSSRLNRSAAIAVFAQAAEAPLLQEEAAYTEDARKEKQGGDAKQDAAEDNRSGIQASSPPGLADQTQCKDDGETNTSLPNNTNAEKAAQDEELPEPTADKNPRVLDQRSLGGVPKSLAWIPLVGPISFIVEVAVNKIKGLYG